MSRVIDRFIHTVRLRVRRTGDMLNGLHKE